MIKLEHIYKSFHHTTILNDINLEIKDGEIISIIGPSGSGKSTILRIINHLIRPDTGKVYYNNQCITDKNAQKIRLKMGMVFQHFELFPHKTVLENITLGGQKLTKNNKTIEIKDPEVTNARQSTIKDKTFANVDARIEELEADVDKIETTRGHVYGIRRKITNNSSSAWERLFDSVGKVANATKNGGTVQNDFDSLAPWSEIKSCNYDLTTKKINAWFGDANFQFDGSNGDCHQPVSGRRHYIELLRRDPAGHRPEGSGYDKEAA